jgi:hypothetical protein
MGLKTKEFTIKNNFKRTNRVQDDDVNHKGKYFWRKKNKCTFLNYIFDLSPYRFTQISSVVTRWMHN